MCLLYLEYLKLWACSLKSPAKPRLRATAPSQRMSWLPGMTTQGAVFSMRIQVGASVRELPVRTALGQVARDGHRVGPDLPDERPQGVEALGDSGPPEVQIRDVHEGGHEYRFYPNMRCSAWTWRWCSPPPSATPPLPRHTCRVGKGQLSSTGPARSTDQIRGGGLHVVYSGVLGGRHRGLGFRGKDAALRRNVEAVAIVASLL